MPKLTERMRKLVEMSNMPGGMIATYVAQVQDAYQQVASKITAEGLSALNRWVQTEFPSVPGDFKPEHMVEAAFLATAKLDQQTKLVMVTPASQSVGVAGLQVVMGVLQSGSVDVVKQANQEFQAYALSQGPGLVDEGLRASLSEAWRRSNAYRLHRLKPEARTAMEKVSDREQASAVLAGHGITGAQAKECLLAIGPEASQYEDVQTATQMADVALGEVKRMESDGTVETRRPDLFPDWASAFTTLMELKKDGSVARLSQQLGRQVTDMELMINLTTLPSADVRKLIRHYGDAEHFRPDPRQYKTKEDYQKAVLDQQDRGKVVNVVYCFRDFHGYAGIPDVIVDQHTTPTLA
jgi:hypothetical protein